VSGRWRYRVVVFGVVALALAACSNDKTPSGTSSPTGTTVNVTLQEYTIIPASSSAPAGKITFTAKNTGPKQEHEFVVVKTDLAPEALPVGADGSVNEEGAGITAVGELEDIAVGTSKTTSFTMAAGKYVLFCNVVDNESTDTLVHYKLGMRTAFTVT
jgi:hypothetical protein